MFEDESEPDPMELLELDLGATDREIFRHLWWRAEDGDLGTRDGWEALHERYPSDPAFHLLAVAMGTEWGRTATLAAHENLVASAPPELAALVASAVRNATNHIGSGPDRDRLAALADELGAPADVLDARDLLFRFESETLTQGELRTRGDARWAPESPPNATE